MTAAYMGINIAVTITVGGSRIDEDGHHRCCLAASASIVHAVQRE
jgi:hypothetical protein